MQVNTQLHIIPVAITLQLAQKGGNICGRTEQVEYLHSDTVILARGRPPMRRDKMRRIPHAILYCLQQKIVCPCIRSKPLQR